MSVETAAPAVPMVTLTIDEKEIQVPKGTLVIEAARSVGIEIPYLCYHHKLSPYGGCRLCLVEVEKVPKMLASCNTLVADGMVVRTNTDKVKSQRAGSIEFILLNHPLDCPVCDKGGECELQDRTFQVGRGESRMTEPKVHIEDYDLGPLVVRNQDRCIICRRCIKVMEEVVGDPVIEFGQRGVTTEVYTFEHSAFKPGFSGNTIPVCPVGALLSKPFRFRARPWELIKTPTVCNLCSMGCNYRMDVRENRALRVVGLENPQVNDMWLCDRGQFGYDYSRSPSRIGAPMIRRDDRLEEVSWEEAYDYAAQRLGELKRMYGAEAIGFLGSERASNEDLFVFQQFARQVVGSNHIDHRMGPGRGDYGPTRPRPGAIQALPKSDVVLLFGSDLTAEVPVMDLVLKRSLLKGKMTLIVAHPRRVALQEFAGQWLRYAPGVELAAANALVMALLEDNLVPEATLLEQRASIEAIRRGFGTSSLAELAATAGLEVGHVRAAAQAFAGAKLASVVYSRQLADSPDGPSLLAALRNLALLSGQAEREGHVFLEAVEQCNTWGARDWGVLPDSGPGYSAAKRGMPTNEMLRALGDGKLRALFVMGSNPVVDYPNTELVTGALDRAEFLVVQDLFLTETAALADLVLPTVTSAEENSTLTNVEGRVQRTVRALNPMGATKPDWLILTEIAARMGSPLPYSSVDEVLAHLRASAAELNSLQKDGILQQVETPSAPPAPEGYPLRLITGATMFNHDTLQRHTTVLPKLAGEPYVELHPTTAEGLGITAGCGVIVEGDGGGSLALQAVVSDATPEGAAFVPAGFNEAPVSRLLNDEGRAVWVRVNRTAGEAA